ncbi:MAG: hypothetical protein ABIG44_10215 [Planctomycetota bacterium]
MKPKRVITEQDTAAIFDEAVQEHALAVLTLQNDNNWQTFKSRFLERDSSGHFFVLDYLSPNGDDLPELTPGQFVGVSFRHHSRKVLFATVVEARGHFVLDNRTTVPAIRYRWPESMTELQRRSYYRTPVPESLNLIANIWSGGLPARTTVQNSTLQITSGTLADVSCGGALVRMHEATPTPWNDNDIVGFETQLADGKPAVMLDAYYRGARHDELGQFNAALQFIGLELTIDGRLVLQRLAKCVQKFHRMSIASGHGHWGRHARG